MTREQFVDVMVEVGCTQAKKGSVEAAKVFDEKGFTEEQMEEFRNTLDQNDQMEIGQEIAMKVAKCFGVKMESQEDTR